MLCLGIEIYYILVQILYYIFSNERYVSLNIEFKTKKRKLEYLLKKPERMEKDAIYFPILLIRNKLETHKYALIWYDLDQYQHRPWQSRFEISIVLMIVVSYGINIILK